MSTNFFFASEKQVSYDKVDLDQVSHIDIKQKTISLYPKNGFTGWAGSGYWCFIYTNDVLASNDYHAILNFLNKNKGVSMFKSLTQDFKGFVSENKQVIYWVALMFIVDHVFLGGAFRERLHSIVSKMLGKIEQQVGSESIKLVDKKA